MPLLDCFCSNSPTPSRSLVYLGKGCCLYGPLISHQALSEAKSTDMAAIMDYISQPALLPWMSERKAGWELLTASLAPQRGRIE